MPRRVPPCQVTRLPAFVARRRAAPFSAAQQLRVDAHLAFHPIERFLVQRGRADEVTVHRTAFGWGEDKERG